VEPGDDDARAKVLGRERNPKPSAGVPEKEPKEKHDENPESKLISNINV